MAPLLLPRTDPPPSSAEMQVVDYDRLADVTEKHRLVSEFLISRNEAALLLQQPGNFAWFTTGGDNSRRGSSQTTAALFITTEARVVICGNVDSPLLFEKEIAGLGFQLKERPWHEPRHVLIDDLCRGRRVASDTGYGNTNDVSLHLTGLRLPLTELECGRMRRLGKLVAHAVEATARTLTPGRTEAEIAGEVAHRLMKHQVVPEQIQVLGDGRGQRMRHWAFGEGNVEKFCTISVIGRMQGLSAGAARSVCLTEPPAELLTSYQQAAMVQATGMFFSQKDWEIFEIWNRIRRIYEKCGSEDEWRLADQATVLGYEVGEVPFVPNSQYRLAPGMPLFWHPSVGPAHTGDTVLVGNKSLEILTAASDWPMISVAVKGTEIEVPAILRRAV